MEMEKENKNLEENKNQANGQVPVQNYDYSSQIRAVSLNMIKFMGAVIILLIFVIVMLFRLRYDIIHRIHRYSEFRPPIHRHYAKQSHFCMPMSPQHCKEYVENEPTEPPIDESLSEKNTGEERHRHVEKD